MNIVDEIRFLRVATRAQYVHINEDKIADYARTLPAGGAIAPARLAARRSLRASDQQPAKHPIHSRRKHADLPARPAGSVRR